MFRAISETAVEISVASVRENPRRSARARASARAATRSESELILTTTSFSIDAASECGALEHCARLVEIVSGFQRTEIEVELDEGDRDVGADSDDHGFRAAKASNSRERLERPSDEGVDHVERGHVDDDTARAFTSDSLG